MTKSRKLTNQPIDQTHKPAVESQKDLLEQLPDEVLFQIIQYVYDARTNIGETYQQKDKQIITLVSKDSKPLYIYQHTSEAPILTRFQSFSLLNRRIHRLCRPFIWKVLAMPHPVARPISFWGQVILPKYAFYVKEFRATLETEWIQRPHTPRSITQASRDKDQHHFTFRSSDVNKFKLVKSIKPQPRPPKYNPNTRYKLKRRPSVEHIHFNDLDSHLQKNLLDIEHEVVLRRSSDLSPKHLYSVLAPCRNLTTLCLEFPPNWHSIESEVSITNLSRNLTALFFNLQNLQTLKYLGPEFASIPAESIIDPLEHLSLLESLELKNVSVLHWGRTNCLASSLSNLKNLKQLVLMHVNVIDDTWGPGRHKAPPQLAKLVIHHYPNPWSLNLPSYISSWAPHITDLELKFDQHQYAEPDEILPHFDPERHRFILPALTHLTIYRHLECETFHCFRGCSNLRHLTVRSPSEVTLSEFVDFIINGSFPKLKEIVMPMKYIDSPRSTLDSKLSPLEDFCQVEGIGLEVFWGFAPKPRLVRSLDA